MTQQTHASLAITLREEDTHLDEVLKALLVASHEMERRGGDDAEQ